MSHWNYRVVRSTYEKRPFFEDENESEYYYSIREVYYNNKNEIVAISSEEQAPRASSVEDLQIVLNRMLKACEKDVLIEEEIKYGDWD